MTTLPPITGSQEDRSLPRVYSPEEVKAMEVNTPLPPSSQAPKLYERAITYHALITLITVGGIIFLSAIGSSSEALIALISLAGVEVGVFAGLFATSRNG